MDDYAAYTYGSCFGPKRWAHRKRLADALRLLELSPNDTLLDYGCGDGALLQMALAVLPPQRLAGYEPAPSMRKLTETLQQKGVRIISDTSVLRNEKFSKVTCLEVLEHLPPGDVEEALAEIASLLAPGGLALLSVPVEIGPPAVVKNAFRWLFGNREGITLRGFVRSALGLPCRRPKPKDLDGMPYIFSHIGFDYRKFERKVADFFRIKRRVASPFPLLGPLANNVVFYVCEGL